MASMWAHHAITITVIFVFFAMKDQDLFSVSESGILGPTKRRLHGFHVGTPCDHSDIVFFPMEDQDLFLFNLQKRSMCCDDLVCCIVGQDLLLLLLGGGGNAVAGRGCRVNHLDSLALGEIV